MCLCCLLVACSWYTPCKMSRDVCHRTECDSIDYGSDTEIHTYWCLLLASRDKHSVLWIGFLGCTGRILTISKVLNTITFGVIISNESWDYRVLFFRLSRRCFGGYIFWDKTSRHWLKGYRRLEGPLFLRSQGFRDGSLETLKLRLHVPSKCPKPLSQWSIVLTQKKELWESFLPSAA